MHDISTSKTVLTKEKYLSAMKLLEDRLEKLLGRAILQKEFQTLTIRKVLLCFVLFFSAPGEYGIAGIPPPECFFDPTDSFGCPHPRPTERKKHEHPSK